MNLSAGGQLTSNGQITTGSGASTLSGSDIVLNGNSALQGGGDITLASRGNITANGFAGTTGSLTLSAPGAIINTALLYAANNWRCTPTASPTSAAICWRAITCGCNGTRPVMPTAR